ncbi:hypothetical protein [Actinomadura parmotrematis]|uniref:Type 2A encapsulin shell protein SrpI-like domain-containing protein n=1 Tax=Actinomadura parmotrematis TaxID=2864039 RepID=A0ABS7FLK1_9ACTN|nr:hypothetical protein [Actinomadura parmotrematis]MBW8481246.1 hypothetical protein [Actinomadura parmotrematis]
MATPLTDAPPSATALTTGAARLLATTAKTPPLTAGTTPRWLLRILPWTDVPGGTYRVTRTERRTLERAGSDQPGVPAAAGHTGEPVLPGMGIAYGVPPREYPLSLAQAVLRVHTRVADVHSDPMDQFAEQLRLTLDALRERQEHDLVNDPGFGLLHAPPPRHRIATRTGPPTPADLDALICKQTSPRHLLAHPLAIAAFGRQCNRRRLQPDTVAVDGHRLLAWRGLPLLPCDKIPVAGGTTTILVVRPGEDRQGVVGLRPAELPDQHEPGVSVRRLGVDARAVESHLVTAYHSLAVPVPNAVCALDGVELGH